MNTTPTTSEPRPLIPYTVLGGARWDRVRRYPYRLTILVLSRGDRLFRGELLKELSDRDLGEILWVEGPDQPSDVESLARDFPQVRFLLLRAPATAGEWVNVGIEEARAPLVLCLWSDTRLSSFHPAILGDLESHHAVCVVPVSRNARLEIIPSWQSPGLRRRRFLVSFRAPRKEGEPTLYPFDYCGLYDRQRFAQSGGYDPAIHNPYWQRLDFGLRCLLWGERLCGTLQLTVTYTGSPPTDDATPDQGYKLFFLKCVAVRLRREMGTLPRRRLLDYMIKSDTGPFYAIKEFRSVRSWVWTHRFRFRKDPRQLVERWENG